MDRELRVLALLAQLQRLSPADAKTAARLTVRNSDGEFIGEALLSDKAVTALTESTLSLNLHLQSEPTAPGTDIDIDPHLVAAIEDHFAKVDPESYLADVFGGPDAEASLHAYEQLVTGEWDGEL
ncbi:hypothetical protein [Streptomyces atratus]|uniref:hypothetical protein n=1 Tax=Streptomyces atratus TaxID=1893 RepID=UPI002F91682A